MSLIETSNSYTRLKIKSVAVLSYFIDLIYSLIQVKECPTSVVNGSRVCLAY